MIGKKLGRTKNHLLRSAVPPNFGDKLGCQGMKGSVRLVGREGPIYKGFGEQTCPRMQSIWEGGYEFGSLVQVSKNGKGQLILGLSVTDRKAGEELENEEYRRLTPSIVKRMQEKELTFPGTVGNSVSLQLPLRAEESLYRWFGNSQEQNG